LPLAEARGSKTASESAAIFWTATVRERQVTFFSILLMNIAAEPA
jgi:hypothetical protein